MVICHVTSVHRTEDTRIFFKECCSLAKNHNDEVYLVQQGGSYDKNGVHIRGYGKQAKSRLARFFKSAKSAYQNACEINADIYHLHDPELLPYARKLKKKGKAVIFDSHEFNTEDIKQKEYLPKIIGRIISAIYGRYEAHVVRKIDGVISVSPDVCDYFSSINHNTVMITNYPILTEYVKPDYKSRRLGFFGGIKDEWSQQDIISVLGCFEDVKYRIGGFVSDTYLEKLKALPGWKNTEYLGKIPGESVPQELQKCSVGLALCKPNRNSGGMKGTLGNTKIFEEMMAGLPVICTGFELWSFVEEYQCGITVDPSNQIEIKGAIMKLVNNPHLCEEMGLRARKAVEEEFNWGVEEKKLFSFYTKIKEEIK